MMGRQTWAISAASGRFSINAGRDWREVSERRGDWGIAVVVGHEITTLELPERRNWRNHSELGV